MSDTNKKKVRTASTGMEFSNANTGLDLSYMEACPVILSQWTNLKIVLVGCGGTGSWLVPHLARFTKILRNEQGKDAKLILFDHDVVEEKNCQRQNFTFAEIGLPKASTLALRYGTMWGLDITAHTTRYTARLLSNLRSSYGERNRSRDCF